MPHIKINIIRTPSLAKPGLSFPGNQIKEAQACWSTDILLNSTLQLTHEQSKRSSAKPLPQSRLQAREATSVPSNEDQAPLPDWSLKGRVWLIYSQEVRGSHEAVHSGWPECLAGTVHSWGWAVSEVSCLSGVGYGRDRNECHQGAGDGVAVGGGAKPSPASGMREEQQLYYLLLYSEW